ncbi:HipA N-terminal domain-containing protein [Arthrobacter sp. NPDC093128]|uniref:HipA N-terminal domain-containing protein n=1 Tax=Arthrobacter sp. NPDC093128 TaxID=3154979 RepID=UPI00343E394C
MSPRKTLDVFLRGTRIGELKGSGLRLSYQYDRATVAEYGSGSILLSLSLPVSRNTFKSSHPGTPRTYRAPPFP